MDRSLPFNEIPAPPYVIVRPDWVDIDGILDDLGARILVEEVGTDHHHALERARTLAIEWFKTNPELRAYLDFAGVEELIEDAFRTWSVPKDDVWHPTTTAPEGFYEELALRFGTCFYFVEEKK